MSDTKITITHSIKLTIKSIEFELTREEAEELQEALIEAFGLPPNNISLKRLLERHHEDSVMQAAPPPYFIDHKEPPYHTKVKS